jgi:hypothetical protein
MIWITLDVVKSKAFVEYVIIYRFHKTDKLQNIYARREMNVSDSNFVIFMIIQWERKI